MSEKHTQGPLTVHGPSPGRPRDDDGGDYAIRDCDGYIIGEAIHKVDFVERRPAKENAQLWATAHELLDALTDARSAIESLPADALGEAYRVECAADGEGGVMTWPIRDELLDKITRAINKARA